MKEKDLAILKQFASAIRNHFPEAAVWAFGSRARGDASEYSDFDICVVVEHLDEAADKIIMETAWLTGFSNDIVISTVTYSKNDFENGTVSHSPFIKSVVLHGKAA